MIMFREIDLTKKPKKSLLKKPTEERKKSNKTIKWIGKKQKHNNQI